MLEPQEPPTIDIFRKRKPAWVREIIQEVERYGTPEGSTRTSKRSNPYSSYVSLMCDLLEQEPTRSRIARRSKRSKPYSSYVALMCDLVDQEPTSYEEPT